VTGHVRNELSGGPFYGPVVQAGSIDSITFVAPGAASVPVDVAVRDPRPVYASVLSGGFTGREWLVAEVDGFLERQASGYVWIEADAGMGKTALVAHLARERGWIVHFARYANGGSVRAGLRNLAGQLIVRYDRWDLAPGRMLPEWTSTPEGFEALLAQVAAADEPVVLLVDGADEAVAEPGAQPWGLPGLLPDGVFVVGTYRTGSPPVRADAPRTVLRLSADDERNERDLLAHLDLVRHEDALAALPVADLAARCGGVWVYLRYVLDEMRLGLRSPDELGDLPGDLRSYYLDQLRRWQTGPHWHDTVLPLLATLAAAGEALTLDLVASMSHTDERRVREWCQGRLRPFLTATAGPPRRFEIYHASFRELFTAAESENEDERAWAEELTSAVLAAHSRIADHGLADVSGYALRHLVTHLIAADRVTDLDALLCREENGANVWFTAHSEADTLDRYVVDLEAARAHHAARTDASLLAGGPAPDLLVELRLLLMLSSVANLTTTVSDNLLAAIAEHGVWSPTRVVNHARRLPDPFDRVHALAAVLPYLPADRQPAVLAEILEATNAVTGAERCLVRTRLAPFLSAEEVASTFAEGIAIDAPDTRSHVIAGLAPFLSTTQLDEALTTALAIADSPAREDTVRELVPHLSTAQCDAAFPTVQAIPDADDRLTILKLVSPGLSPRRREDAVAVALAVENTTEAVRAAADLIDHLPPSSRPHWTAEALARVDRLTDDDHRAATRVWLGRHLSADQVAEAHAAVEAISGPGTRSSLLAQLAPHLPATPRDAVVARVREQIADWPDEADVLATLAPFLPLDGVADALTAAIAPVQSGDDLDEDVERLLLLAPHLPPDLLTTALGEVPGIQSDEVRQQVLVGLAPLLSPDQLAMAVRLAADIGTNRRRVDTLLGLVPHLPTRRERASAVADALAAANELSGHIDEIVVSAALLPHLPDADRREVCAELVTTRLTADGDTATAVRILRHAAPYLTTAELTPMWWRRETLLAIARHGTPEALDVALDAARQSYWGAYKATAMVAEMVPLLSPEKLDRLLATANDLGPGRGMVLAAAVPCLPAERQSAIVSKALTAAKHDPAAQLGALCSLFPYLSRGQLRTALSTSDLLSYAHQRFYLLREIAEYVPVGDLHLVEAASGYLADRDYQDAVAMALARRKPVPRRDAAMATVLSNVEESVRAGGFQFTDALTLLEADLPPELAERVLDIAITLPEHSRARVLGELGPHLPPSLLPKALAAIEALDNEQARALTLAELAIQLPELAPGALDAIADVDHNATRDRALTSLAPHLPADALLTAVGSAGTAAGLPPLLARAVDLEEHATVVALLRATLPAVTRSDALEILVPALPTLRELTGPDLGPRVRETVTLVHRWWP